MASVRQLEARVKALENPGEPPWWLIALLVMLLVAPIAGGWMHVLDVFRSRPTRVSPSGESETAASPKKGCWTRNHNGQPWVEIPCEIAPFKNAGADDENGQIWL